MIGVLSGLLSPLIFFLERKQRERPFPRIPYSNRHLKTAVYIEHVSAWRYFDYGFSLKQSVSKKNSQRKCITKHTGEKNKTIQFPLENYALHSDFNKQVLQLSWLNVNSLLD